MSGELNYLLRTSSQDSLAKLWLSKVVKSTECADEARFDIPLLSR